MSRQCYTLAAFFVGEAMIIQPTRLHWIMDDGTDDPSDLCAHSPILFAVGGKTLLTPDQESWTVSAAAILLLRTLTADRPALKSGDLLFPCCGFTMWDVGEPDVLLQGCGSGHDFAVARAGSKVALSRWDGWSAEVPFKLWQNAVLEFSGQVRQFYDRSLPKQLPENDEDKKGYALFLSEWERRHPR